jgi:hypothetical protein
MKRAAPYGTALPLSEPETSPGALVQGRISRQAEKASAATIQVLAPEGLT